MNKNCEIGAIESKIGKTKVCVSFSLLLMVLLGSRQYAHLSLAVDLTSWHRGRISERSGLNCYWVTSSENILMFVSFLRSHTHIFPVQYQRRLGIGRGSSGLRGAVRRAERRHICVGRPELIEGLT